MKKEEQSEDNSNSFGIAAVVFGILSITLFFTGIPSAIFGIIGIVFALRQRKKSKNKWAKAGLILSVIGLVLSIILIILFGMLISQITKTIELLQQCSANPNLPGCEKILPAIQGQSGAGLY